MLRVQDHVARLEMRIARDLLDVGDRRTWHRRVAEQSQPMIAPMRRESAREDCLELRMVGRPIGVGEKSRVVLELWHRDRVAEADPDTLVARAHHEVVVGRAKLLERRDRRMPRAEPSGNIARYRVARERILEHRDLAIEHRDIDVIADAVAVTHAQGRHDRNNAVKRGRQIADRYAASHRLTAGIAGDTHRAAERLRHDVVGGRRSLRSGLPEPGNRAQDYFGIGGLELLVAELETIHRAGREILNHYIRFCRQLEKDSGACFGAQVERDAALAAIDAVEVARVAGRHHRREAARIVAASWHLDFNNVGAKIRQVHRAKRPCQNPRQVEHANPPQRLLIDHRLLSSLPRPAGRRRILKLSFNSAPIPRAAKLDAS